ncbi:MAG: RluA family pseudouridine synthase [Thermodesulfovibrionales bacterium]|nr:RluA family pseudouridine synthase [Thermodesulfovibrionales bacterium]
MIKLISPVDNDIGKRLDVFLAEKTGITRSQIQKIIKEGNVLVNNCLSFQNYKVKLGDVIRLTKKEEERKDTLKPQDIPIEILYQDDHIIVVNKPSKMVVYPSYGHPDSTLLNAVYFHTGRLPSVGSPLRKGVVHRLDKDTTGVIVIAIDDSSYYNLVEQFRSRIIKRKYIALVYGNLKDESGKIEQKIGRSSVNRKKMTVKAKIGKEAVTHWKVISRFKQATLIEVTLGTGRTHQIRVHFSSIGHPVLGDSLYGRKTLLTIERKAINFPRQMLHAQTLGFKHPVKDIYMEFTCPIPDDFVDSIKKLT